MGIRSATISQVLDGVLPLILLALLACNHDDVVDILIPLTDWAQNAHSLTVQRGQNAHYVPSLYRVLDNPNTHIRLRVARGTPAHVFIPVIKWARNIIYSLHILCATLDASILKIRSPTE